MRTCKKCDRQQDISRFKVSRAVYGYNCIDCLNAARAVRRATPASRTQRNAAKRAKRLARGCTPRPFNGGMERRRAEAEARKAWKHWMRIAPNWWMRAYYRALGRPWSNPRVAKANKYRIRYWLDSAFRAKEIAKVQTLKVKRAALIEATSDGTLTGEVIVGLFASSHTCAYCDKAMRSVEKTLDHKLPLSRGGHHTIRNVVVCCKTCNTSKGARTYEEWSTAIFRESFLGSFSAIGGGWQRGRRNHPVPANA